MSELQERLDELQANFIKMQFRTSRKSRFRVYRKLEGMLKTNEALSRSLDRLYQNVTEMGKYPNRVSAIALREWFLKDRAGISLSQAMEGWVPAGELYMIRAGEESGTLAKALASIQSMGERGREMRQAVSYAVGYPVFMFILVGFVIWTFGVNLIANMRANAPKNVMEAIGGVAAFSDFISAWGLWIVAFLIVLIIIIVFTLPNWRGLLRAKFDMYPPWLWYRVLQGSGFLLGLSALLGAQVPLKRSMEILEEQGKPWIKERIGLARQMVLRGHNLGEALRLTHMNFPDPAVAVDLEILAERADVGAVIEQVTEEWMREQVDSMKAQAVVIRNVGMALVGGIIAWVMMSIFAIVGELSKGNSGGGGY
ncbi:MAG: type II secretion system F family protein [Alphaproteobacteria bacterium]|nr:type II secretion system F family protein [Alphaproteobacteria bacterium]